MKRFFASGDISRNSSPACAAGWTAVMAIAALAATGAVQAAEPAKPVSEAGAAAHASQPASGKINSALDSTLISGGYQFKGAGAHDRRSSAGSAADAVNPLASAINDAAGVSAVKFQKIPPTVKDSGICSPGAPHSLGHCYTKTQSYTKTQPWMPASQ